MVWGSFRGFLGVSPPFFPPSIKRSNCYMVWGGEFAAPTQQARVSHTDLVIGCLVDLATGLMTFTANGKEINTFFQVSCALQVRFWGVGGPSPTPGVSRESCPPAGGAQHQTVPGSVCAAHHPKRAAVRAGQAQGEVWDPHPNLGWVWGEVGRVWGPHPSLGGILGVRRGHLGAQVRCWSLSRRARGISMESTR